MQVLVLLLNKHNKVLKLLHKLCQLLKNLQTYIILNLATLKNKQLLKHLLVLVQQRQQRDVKDFYHLNKHNLVVHQELARVLSLSNKLGNSKTY